MSGDLILSKFAECVLNSNLGLFKVYSCWEGHKIRAIELSYIGILFDMFY